MAVKTRAINSTEMTAPFVLRQLPPLNRCSKKDISLPKPTTGCGNHAGSPNNKSNIHPIRSAIIPYAAASSTSILES